MSYLLRVVLPDRPGSLGALATALGGVGADIVGLDVVERTGDDAVDDIIVELPAGGLADSLLSAAHSVEGVVVESLRPFMGSRGLHRELELVEEVAADPTHGLQLLTEHAPAVFRAGWALLLERVDGRIRVLHTSAGAPDVHSVEFPWLPLGAARRLPPGEAWVPQRWNLLGMEMAAAPVGRAEVAILVGRPGGPRFLDSEVLRLAHLAGIATTVLHQPANA